MFNVIKAGSNWKILLQSKDDTSIEAEGYIRDFNITMQNDCYEIMGGCLGIEKFNTNIQYDLHFICEGFNYTKLLPINKYELLVYKIREEISNNIFL